jgi:DNA-binding beta-propeller fold protein YncE
MENLPYKLVVIDDTSHALLLVDSPNGEIIAEMSYPVGFSPTELAISPDLTKAYLPVVGSNGSGGLFVANLTQKSIYRLPMKIPQPIQFTLAPDGIWAYLVDPAGMLYALDIPSMSLKNLGNPANAACVGLAADHIAVYSVWEHSDHGSLAVFLRDGQLLYEHTLPGIPTNITLDNCGHIFIPFTSANFTIEGVVLFNRTIAADNTLTVSVAQRCIYPYSTSPSAAYPSHVAAYPDDHIAYVVNEENASITVIDSNTAAIIRHIEIGRSISCLHILPGGQFGIATSHIFSDLCMIDLHNNLLLSTTNTERELLGYLAVIPQCAK